MQSGWRAPPYPHAPPEQLAFLFTAQFRFREWFTIYPHEPPEFAGSPPDSTHPPTTPPRYYTQGAVSRFQAVQLELLAQLHDSYYRTR